MAARSAARRKQAPPARAGRPTLDLPCLRGEITVVGFLNPLKPHESIAAYMPAGSSLADIIGDAHERVWIQVDGVDVPRIQWGAVRPAAWNLVTVHQQPGKSGKGLLGIIAGIGLGAITGGLGFALSAGLSASLTFTTSGLIAAAAAGAVIGGLQGIVGALFAPQQPKTPNQTQITQRPSWAGVSNQITPFGPVPQPFGRYISYPIIVGAPFTEVIGDDQYLHCLFCTGIGSFHLSDWKIGDTALDQFDGVEVVVSGAHTTFDDDYGGRVTAGNVFDLYGQTVNEQFLTVGLTYKEGDDGSDPVPSATRTTETGTTRISMDLTCPTGLMSIQKKTGDPRSGVITFRVEYKAHADSTWTNLNTRDDAKLVGPNFVVDGDHYSVTAAQPSTLRLGLDWTVDAGQYDVRVTYLDYTKPSGTTGKSEVEPTFQWTALRSWKPGRPVNQVMVDKTTLVAVKIKATNQTQTLDKVNMIAETKLRVWDSETGTWSDPQVTRNPAWAAVEVLTGIGNASPANDNQLNLDDFAAFAEDCTSLGLEFNDPGLDQVSVLARLRMMLNGALAEWRFDDTGLGVIRDTADDTPTQMLTPVNSWDFKSTKTFLDLPHAFKVPFADPDNGYQQNYAILYTDGYSEDGAGDTAVATQFLTLDYRGSTSHDQSYKYAVFHEAQLRLRPETYEATMDAESVVCRRGDVISATHDIAMWGLGYGQVLEVTTNEDGDATAVRVDEPLKADGGAISVRIRRFDGTLVIQALDDLEAGTYTTLPFAAPVSGLEGGELISYGGEALLKVASIKPKGKLQATLTFVDAAPEIRTAVATGSIPDYDPQIRPRVQTPPTPRVLSVQAGDQVAHVAADGTVSRRIVVAFDYAGGLFVPVAVEGQIRRTDQDTNAPFGPTQRAPLPPAQIGFAVSGQPGATFEFRIRTVAADGTPSKWLTSTATLAGDLFDPDPVTGLALAASEDGRSITVTWDAADFARYAYTEIQRDTASTFATAVTAGTPSGAPWVDTVAPENTYWYRARHVSTTLDVDGTPISGDWCTAVSVVAPAAVTYLLDKLSGELTETQLATDLKSRIDLIDADASVAGSVAAQVAAEATARAAAVSAEASARVAAVGAVADSLSTTAAGLAQEVTDRAAAVTAEATARANAVSSEATTRSNADGALSDRLDTVEASASGNSAAIAAEATARADADTAIAGDVTALDGRLQAQEWTPVWATYFNSADALARWTASGNGECSIADDNASLVGGKSLHVGNNSGDDGATLRAKDLIPIDTGKLYRIRWRIRVGSGSGAGMYAGLVPYDRSGTVIGASAQYLASSSDTATGSYVEHVGYFQGVAASGAGDVGEKPSEAAPGQLAAGTALIQPFLRALYPSNTGAVAIDYYILECKAAAGQATYLSDAQARVTKAEGTIVAQTTLLTGLRTDVDANEAAITSESTARSTADSALSTRIDAVVATAGDNTASIASEATARASADGALSDRIDAIEATAGTNTASIASQATALATETDTRASQVKALQAKALSAAFLDTFDGGSIDWSQYTGGAAPNVVIAAITDGPVGGHVLRAGDNAGTDYTPIAANARIPFDPDRLYRVRFLVRKPAGPTQKTFLGVIGFAADGTTQVTTGGAGQPGALNYVALSNDTVGTDWTEYVGYIKGFASGAGDSTPHSDPLTPAKLHADTRYIAPLMLLNYNSGAGETEVALVSLETGNAYANASIIDSHTTELETIDGTLTANAATLAGLRSDVDDNEAAITSEASTRASADSALSTRIDAVVATAGDNAAAITSEATARSDADDALTTQVTTAQSAAVAAQSTANAKNKTYSQASAPTSGMTAGDLWFDSDDNNKAYRYSGSAWVAAADARIATNAAAITSEASTRASADGALSDRIDAVVATAGSNTSAISAEATARSDGDDANAALIAALQAKSMAVGFADTFDGGSLDWTGAGGGEVAIVPVTNSPIGGNVLRFGNNAGTDYVNAVSNTKIPFDKNKLYKIRIVMIRSSAGSQTTYFGVRCYAADGTTRVSVTGSSVGANDHYIVLANTLVPSNTYTEYVGYIKGYASGNGDSSVKSDPLAPGKVHADTRYFSLTGLFNYNSGPGIQYVAGVFVEIGEVDANASVINSQGARLTTAEGNISTQADDIESLQTTQGGHTASIATLISSMNGVQVQWAIQTDVDGRVTGIKLISGADTSDFVILADKFIVADPDAPDTAIFAVVDGQVLMRNALIAGLPAANIGANELHATTLVETSTTRNLPITTQTGHSLTVPDPTSWATIETVTVTVASTDDDVTVEYNLRMAVSNFYFGQFYDEHWYNDVIRMRIVMDGTTVIRDEVLNQLVHSDASTANTKQIVSNGTIPVAAIAEYITGLSVGTHTFVLQAAGIDMTDQVTTSTLAASVTHSFAKGEVLHATGV